MLIENNAEPTITFVSTVLGMVGDTSIHPQPASKFYPNWWKSMPSKIDIPSNSLIDEYVMTVKSCPSFVHWFAKGFVLPAWCDMTVKYDPETKSYGWVTAPGSPYKIGAHVAEQYTDHVDHTYQGKNATFVFKLFSPWRAITPEGWSILQLPMFYHFDREWSVAPGIIDTDVYHELNQQIIYYGNNEEVFIPKGAPLCHYMPYQRGKQTLEVREMTEEDNYRFKVSDLQRTSKQKGAYLSIPRVDKAPK